MEVFMLQASGVIQGNQRIRLRHEVGVREPIPSYRVCDGNLVPGTQPGSAAGTTRKWAQHLPLLPMLHILGQLPPLTCLTGVEEQRPLMINFTRPASWHLLVEGPRESGRSELLRACAAGLALSNRQSRMQFIGIDMGCRELAFLESMPHMLTDLVSDWLFGEEILRWLVQEMQHRRLGRISNPHLFVWIHEADVLLSQLSFSGREKLEELWEKGPQHGIHIAATISSDFEKSNAMFRSLASVVHISLRDQQPRPGPGVVQARRGEVRSSGRVTGFQPVSFTAREMNTAAQLFSAGFRMTGQYQPGEGVADGIR
jgi:hypothetical protein